MSVFVSYARKDQPAVERLRTDIERCRRAVWFDREVTGGHLWWSAILEQIRGCEAFVFALSPDSVKSRACLAELEYARQLGRPILPIMVRDVNISWAPRAVADTQVIDYRNRDADSVFALRDALDLLPAPPPLPFQLPPEPEIPTSYLDKIIDQLNLDELSLKAQTDLFVQLRARMDDEDERPDVRPLLVRLRGRADLAQSLVPDIDRVLAGFPDGVRPGVRPHHLPPPSPGHQVPPQRMAAPPTAEPRPAGWHPDPFGRAAQRYWNGQIWTTMVRRGTEEFDERVRQPMAPPPRKDNTSQIVLWVCLGAVGLFVLFLFMLALAGV